MRRIADSEACACGRRLRPGIVLFEAQDARHGLPGRFTLTMCPGCGLVATMPRPGRPEDWYPDGDYMNYGERQDLISRLFSMITTRTATGRWPSLPSGLAVRLVPAAELGGPLARGTRLLDVGAGSGHAVIALRAAGIDAHGLEPSGRAVEVAHRAGATTVLQGTLTPDRYDPDTWDVVRFWHSLEHVPDPVETLRTAAGTLRPGGRVVIGVPNFGGFGRRIFRRRWDGLEIPRHLWHFTSASLRRTLAAAGLVVVRIRSVPIAGVLPGTIAAFGTSARSRPRLTQPAVQIALHPVELLAAALGGGDGLLAIAHRAPPGTPRT